MKILHIIPNLKKGGAERLVLDICNELQKREDVEVKLITFSTDNEYPFLTNDIDWEVIPSSIKLSILRKNQYQVTELQKAIETFSPDIIHTHLYEAEIVSRSCYYPKASWFSHCHDKMPVFNKKQNSIKKRLTYNYERRYLFRRYKKNAGTSFIAISKDIMAFFKKNIKIYQILLYHNAINFDEFKQINSNQSFNKLQMINTGSFQDKKNQQFLVQIANRLSYKNIDFELHFLGEGKTKSNLISKVKELKLNDRIFFHGNVNKVQEYLWKANVYVHSAIDEPFGLVLLEAMAAGLPVVSLDGGGNRDLIINGHNGYLLKEENVDLFTTTLLNLWKNKNLYLEQKNNAISFAKKYDIKEYVCNLIKLYYIKQK